MCGRYVSAAERSRIEQQFAAIPLTTEVLAPDYNVAPTKNVYAVMNRHEQRQLRIVQWGLIPSWAKDPKIGNKLINARLESAAEKPSFRKAFAKRRAILPADGYYEWYTPESPADSGQGSDSPKRKVKKQPFFIRPRDGQLMAMAGLYEIWRDKSIEDEDAPGAFRWTATVLTTSATDELGRIHDRMPLMVSPEHIEEWLDPELEEPPEGILIPASPGLLEAFPVSTEVNNVRNDGPQLIQPVAEEAPPANGRF